MIANARMYSVSPEVSGLWHELLAAIVGRSGLPISVIEHGAPASIDALWARPDKAAVFMCGLPFSRSQPQPLLVAAPVPSPAAFRGQAQYWSDLVVRATGPYRSIEQTFGHRIAFTTPASQSGYVAALQYFMNSDGGFPRFAQIIAPQITPLGAITAVLNGAAEIAPIDSYAFALLYRYRHDLTSQLRVLARTRSTPIPPLVASADALTAIELAALRAAFLAAHENPESQGLMEQLLVQRFVRPEPRSYEVLRDDFAAASRYWDAHPFAKICDPAFMRGGGL